MDDDANGQPEELVDLAHPLRIALGQIVIDRDDVDAVTGERVQVARQSRHQRLSFAGAHLGDLALMQDHAADHLHVEVTHFDGTPARLADNREGLGQQFLERQPFGRVTLVLVGDAFKPCRNAGAELDGLGAQLFVAERLDLRLKLVDGSHNGLQTLDQPLVSGAKDAGKDFIERHDTLRVSV